MGGCKSLAFRSRRPGQEEQEAELKTNALGYKSMGLSIYGSMSPSGFSYPNVAPAINLLGGPRQNTHSQP